MHIYINGVEATLDQLKAVINQEYLSIRQAEEMIGEALEDLSDDDYLEQVMSCISEATDYQAEIIF